MLVGAASCLGLFDAYNGRIVQNILMPYRVFGTFIVLEEQVI